MNRQSSPQAGLTAAASAVPAVQDAAREFVLRLSVVLAPLVGLLSIRVRLFGLFTITLCPPLAHALQRLEQLLATLANNGFAPQAGPAPTTATPCPRPPCEVAPAIQADHNRTPAPTAQRHEPMPRGGITEAAPATAPSGSACRPILQIPRPSTPRARHPVSACAPNGARGQPPRRAPPGILFNGAMSAMRTLILNVPY
jgi:hypothetical protein